MTRSIRKFFLLNAIFLLVLFQQGDQLHSRYTDYIGLKIIRIDFTGNNFVSDSDLYDLIDSRLGIPLNKGMLNEDIKKIYTHGAFTRVHLEARRYKGGVALNFVLAERSYVNEIEFKGLNNLTEKEINEIILVKRDEVYNEKLISESISLMRSKYEEEGLFNASIKAKIEPIQDDTTLRVIFLIDEGEEIEIIKIEVLGTEILDPEDIIDSMELEEEGFFGDGTFNEDKFEKDKVNILNFIRENGFLDAELIDATWKIVWADEEKVERGINITIKIKEGEQYFFNGYDIEWDRQYINKDTKKPLYEKKQFFNFFEYDDNDTGDIYDDTKVKRDQGAINELYSQQGYIFTQVVPKRTRIILNEKEIKKWEGSKIQKENLKKGKDYFNLGSLKRILREEPEARGRKYIHTKFVIREGDKGYVENIIIKGHEKTQEKVIRREVLIEENQLFNAFLVQRSRENIFNLGFFKQVNIDVRPGSSERKLNLIFDVEEQPTGNISLGGGYGTQSGFTIFSELAENNLNGTGQRVSGKVDFGPLRTSLSTEWREPWLFDVPWSLTLFAYYNNDVRQAGAIIEGREATYQIKSIGFGAELGHRFAIFWGHFHRWSPVFLRYSDPSSLVGDRIFLLANQGWRFKNRLINGIYYDNRDNIFNTTSGMRAEFRWTLTGSILGGGDHYMQYEPSYRFYWWPFDLTFFGLFRKRILRRWRFVFEHRFSMGFTQATSRVYGSQDRTENPYVEPDDYYFLGGYETLRGWRSDAQNYPLAWRDWSSHRMLFGTEFRIPLEPTIIWFVFFFDAGALFEDVRNVLLDDQIDNQGLIQSVRNTALRHNNINFSYFRYSWGFGIRIQIPVLPIRLYLAKKLVWDPASRFFKVDPGDRGFQFEFGIGDRRF